MAGDTEIDEVLYPKIEPYSTGMLPVSDLHTIFWERAGNADGHPVIVIHGGPGGGSQPGYRQYFDPAKFDIIQFDQRGAESLRHMLNCQRIIPKIQSQISKH